MNAFSRTRQGVVGGAVAAAVLAATVGTSFAAPGRTSLQRDVDAIQATGTVGVQAEVSTPTGSVKARVGVANVRGNGHAATRRRKPNRPGRHGRQMAAGLVRGNGNDGTKITVWQLLQHTSGLYDYANDLDIFTEEGFEKHRFDHYAPEQLVEMAMRHHPDFQPGDRNPDGTLK